MSKHVTVPHFEADSIGNLILMIRGQKVLLDADLAQLYQVETKALNRAVKRNKDRFPEDFMFQLTKVESDNLRYQFGTGPSEGKKVNRCQFGTGLQKHRDPRYRPYVFTEQGVAMLSSVLRSKRAVQVNIAIMRAFVRLREIMGQNKVLAVKLSELERKMTNHDEDIKTLFLAIKELMTPSEIPKRKIGFHP